MLENPNLLPSDRLALLCRLSQDFNASLNINEVLNRVMDEVIAATHAERGFVMLLEPDPVAATPGEGWSEKKDHLVVNISHGIDQQTIFSKEFQVSRSVVEQVLQNGQPVLTSDAQTDSRFSGRESVVSLRLRAILCVPLRHKDRLLGAIYVDNRIQAGIFTPLDLELLNAIAANAAIALENARLYRDSQNRLETLTLLHNISKEITSTLDLDRVLTSSIQALQDLLQASSASIITLDEGELIFQTAVGEKASEIKAFRIPMENSIAGWVFKNKQAIIVNDVQHDPRFHQGADEKTGLTTLSMVAAPLIVNENAIGIVEVTNKSGGFTTDDLDLLGTFASSMAFAIENARLYKVAIEKGRMERELQMASKVQSGLLPHAIPTLPGWDLAARWLPARQVAGDYYDFIPRQSSIPGSAFPGIIIADVTDKGMPAALFMAFARSTLRASLYSAPTPAEGIQRANTLISADSPNSMFVTLFYAQVNPQNGETVYVNAGHNPPLLFKKGYPQSEALRLLARTGIPLGIDGDAQYEQNMVSLQTDDFILFYTDGVTDAVDRDMTAFGMKRLQEVALQNSSATAAQIVAALEQSLHEFMKDEEPIDDITIVVLKRLSED